MVRELRSVAAAVIGGANLVGGDGGAIGSFIGALTMGVLGNGLNLLNVSAFWQRVIQGAVIIVVVLADQWRRRKFTLIGQEEKSSFSNGSWFYLITWIT